jgi:hypothetical protein
MTTDPYPPSKLQRSEFGNLLIPVLQQIIKPALAELIRTDPEITNKSTLHTAFKKSTQSTVSFSTFNTWLEALGISFRKVVQIEGITPTPAPGGATGGPRPDAGDEEVRFDNEEQFDFRPSRGFGDAFGEIARQTQGLQ